MQRVFRAMALFVGILVAGTFLFHLVEPMDWFDAFYATLLSITPLGHGLMPALSKAGREINVALLVSGVGVVGYIASVATRFVFEGEMGRVFWRRKVERRVMRMENHVVLCGHGRVGAVIAEELTRHGVSFVVVERDAAAVREQIDAGGDVLLGDATDERVLEAAGIVRARGLVAALESDADNLYITLTAREKNPRIRIVARASDETASAKIRRAGADSTVSPNIIGGREMAQHLLMPAVVNFLHLATGRQSLDLQIQEIHVVDQSPLAGRTLGETPIRREHGVIVVAIYRPGNEALFNPESDYPVKSSDILVCLGRADGIEAIRRLAQAPA